MVMMRGRFPFEWSLVWDSLSHFAWIFLILLGLVGVYTVYFASVVLVRLRSLRTLQNGDSIRGTLALLKHRSANLGQVILAVAYFWGFTFFFQIQGAFYTPDNNRPVGPMVFSNMRIDFSFAAAVFLFFLVLHSVQWFVSGRIGTAARRLGT
jgi:hypothetical protein